MKQSHILEFSGKKQIKSHTERFAVLISFLFFLPDLQQVTVDRLPVQRGVDKHFAVGVVHRLDFEHVLHVACYKCEVDLQHGDTIT